MKVDTSPLFKQRSTRPITYQEAHDELLSTYDGLLGLNTGHDHVSVSDFENPLNGSLYDIWMATYLREGIGELYHMSFDTFLDRPRWMCLMLLQNAKRRRHALEDAKKSVLPPELEKELKERM